MPVVGDVGWISASLAFTAAVVVGELADAAEDFGEVERSRREMPVASRIFSLKRTVLKAAGRAPIDADAQVLQPLDDAAGRGELRRDRRRTRASRGSTVCSLVSE